MDTVTAPPRGRGAAVSATSQLVAKVAHFGLNVVSTLAIIRYLHPSGYGVFVLVLTVATVVGLIADYGLAKLAVRETVAPDAVEGHVLGTIVGLRLGLALIAVALTQVVLLVMGEPPQVLLAGLIASLFYVGDAVLSVVVVAFQVRLVQQYEAAIRTGAEALETAMVLGLVALGAALPWLFVPPLVGVLVGAAIALVLARRRCDLRLHFRPELVRHLVREALPLGPALVIGVLYLKLDSLVVAVMRPERDLGLYGSAYQPVEYLFLASAVLVNVAYPLLARAHGEGDAAGVVTLYRRGTEALVAATLIVPVVAVFVATPLVTSVYGADYADAAAPFQVLCVCLVLMTVNAWQSLVLLSGGFQSLTLRYNAAALVLSVVLCVPLVHVFGMMGAAFAALGTGAFVLVASTALVHRRMGVGLALRPLARIGAAAGVSILVLLAMQRTGAPWFLLPVAAGVVYLGVLVRAGFARSLREALT